MDASLYSSLLQDMEGSTQNPEEPLTKNYLHSLMQLIPEEQPLRPSSVHATNEQKILRLVQNILQKPIQNRSSQQLSIVVSFSNKNKYLKKLQQEIGSDFVRNIMKNAKMLRVPPGKIICKEKQTITHFYLVLSGKLGLKKTQEINTNIEISHIYELLTTIAKKQAKIINRALQEEKIIQVKNFHQIKESIEAIQQQFHDHVWKHQIYGPFDYCVGKQHLNTVITTEQSVLLQFHIYHFLNFLDRSHNARMKKQMSLIEHIPCFKTVPSAKLEQFLGSMTLRKKKRKQLIYKQGDPTQSIYILTHGQIKITKNTSLFEQNPNNFYVNRNKLIDGKQNPMDRPIKLLPYANLTRLYNYRPVSKLIQIGVLSPVCLFGEQQMVQSRIRQTNAECNSLQVIYYEIEIKRIQQIFGPVIMDQFNLQIKNQIKKKLLYRQNQYANNVQLENNKNLDYFYYDGQKEKDSPRKFNIIKINSKISPEISKLRSQSQQLPAFYTTFNFHKMASQFPKNQIKTAKKANNQDSLEDDQQICRDPIEKKLIDISHTWGPITRRVKRQTQLSKKISPFKQTIDIKTPLFQPNYFTQMHLENKRIEKNFRTKKLSLGLSVRKNKPIINGYKQQFD